MNELYIVLSHVQLGNTVLPQN